MGRIPPKSSDSQESLSIINGWIDSCNKKHSKCIVPDLQYVPYRVIDVGIDEDVVKLCESPEKSNRYIALSHCWGGQVDTVTTRSNLNERKSGILMSSLPRTFFDAVQLTRRLGVRYLWIDSREMPISTRSAALEVAAVDLVLPLASGQQAPTRCTGCAGRPPSCRSWSGRWTPG